MSDPTLFDGYTDRDWEYGICYVDPFTGRKSFERNYAGDHRSYEVALAQLEQRRIGNSQWSQSMVARRRRTEWEPMPDTALANSSKGDES